MRQNQLIIRRDDCHAPSAWDVCRQLVKSQRPLELENLFLRYQLNIALRRAPHLRLRGGDRTLLVWMTCGAVALPFLPVSAALFAETFEPPSRVLYPQRKAMRRG